MKRVVVLGNGRSVGLADYVATIRKVRAAPQGQAYKHGLCGWWPTTRETILLEWLEGVHDRINRRLPGYGMGRKWHPDWQRMMLQEANRINTPRLILDWLPPELETRFAHRLRSQLDN